MKTKISYKDCVLKIEEARYFSELYVKPEELEEVIKVLSKKLK